MDDVRFFDVFFQDAAFVETPYLEGVFEYDDFDNGASIPFGVRGGMPLFQQFDIGASFGIVHTDPDFGDEETSISDLELVGRYHLTGFKPVNTTLGMRFDIPTGDKDVGEDTLEFEAFGAIRYPLGKLVLKDHAGLGYVETRKTTVGNFGVIPGGPGFIANPAPTSLNPDPAIIIPIVPIPSGEFSTKEEGDFSLFLSARVQSTS